MYLPEPLISRFRWVIPVLVVLVLTLGFGVDDAAAGTLRGSLTTTSYIFESGGGTYPGTGIADRAQTGNWLLQRVRLDAFPTTVQGPVSVHMSLTARNQTHLESLSDTKTRIYHSYLRYRPGRSMDFRLGRHYRSAGVASGVSDGGSLHLRYGKLVEAVVVGGTLGIENRDELTFEKPDQSRRWGGMLRFTSPVLDPFQLIGGVSFAETARDDVEDTRQIGVHLRLNVAERVRLKYEWRRDLLLDRDVAIVAGAEYLAPGRGYRVWAEYNRREPVIRATSFFASFDNEPRDEARAGFTYPLWRTLAATVDGFLIGSNDDTESRSFRTSLSYYGFSVGWRAYRGFGGNQNSLVGSARVQVLPELTVFANADLVDYRYGHGHHEEDNGAASAVGGLEYRPSRAWMFRGQFETLDHAAKSPDVRGLFSLNYRFGWKY